MRKLILTTFALICFAISASAQSYTTSAGLGIDFGTGQTLVGPTLKHFFNANNAIEADILFGSNNTLIAAYYQYHQDFKGASGLKWYLGGGPAVNLYSGGSSFFLRPMVGLDYKIDNAPLALSFDWRPSIYLGDTVGDRFTAGRFGLGFKYVFK
ncbi:hypothetical protein I5M32_08220 [Pedobacter sp. SD-b]|uniref:Outer membrane insertion C-terminal signal n=1 Tax=Pedobacter segetis TaxID=2793069 RepID=A0ABS1BJE3_9SPHI|nr:hypothetical protein [Pedobacter segetis]MBK0382943.1 hypothetical protein [Pedobacter segetis]